MGVGTYQNEIYKKGVECMAEFKGIYDEKERNRRINKEFKRLSILSEDLPEDKKAVLINLFNEASFMAVTLEETRKIISRDGVIENYKNGANQYGVKKSAAVEVYDKMMNTYSKVIKQICDALPEGSASNESAEELMKFMLEGKVS